MKTKVNWKELIEDWKKSGISKKQFCKIERIPYKNFLYHFNQHQKMQPRAALPVFQQLELQSEQFGDRIDFDFGDGRRVSFPISTPLEVVRILVSI